MGMYTLFADRRATLIEKIKAQHGRVAQDGIIVLIGAFEYDQHAFEQESSFYYLTGIDEPASVCVIDLKVETATLFVPNVQTARATWVSSTINVDSASQYALDAIELLGDACSGYQCHPFFTLKEYCNLIAYLEQIIGQGRTIFTLSPSGVSGYVEQRFVLLRLQQVISKLPGAIQDISAVVGDMRRKKSQYEIECLYKAVQLTGYGQDAATHTIAPEATEAQVHGAIEYAFLSNGGHRSFPSIVATGINGTILHYHQNAGVMKSGELVVVDIGAKYKRYCADITRTYPVSGCFTDRQKKLYQIVSDTQEHVAQYAKPGYWLSNPSEPEKSLNHIARVFLERAGYLDYFPHGIGHYLGIDVHDVGTYNTPLRPGDVITIEPGIYIPEELLGIRIEDDYWIVEDGNICLSEDIPREIDHIEQMVRDLDEII